MTALPALVVGVAQQRPAGCNANARTSLQRTISTELTPKVKAVEAEIVKDTGIPMVLSGESAVVWASDGLDLTSRVVEKMNAQPAVPPAPRQ